MKRLILIRHAKSAWDVPVDDHERVLNERGRSSAKAVGDWLTSNGFVPKTIYTSDSARTLETTDIISGRLASSPVIQSMPQMYHGSPGTLLQVLNGAEDDVVALIAHNPGIGSFASGMVTQMPDDPDFARYPTCATAVIDFDATAWRDVTPHTGELVAFVTPRNL